VTKLGKSIRGLDIGSGGFFQLINSVQYRILLMCGSDRVPQQSVYPAKTDPGMPSRILIADDHEMIRRGFRSLLLETRRDIEVLEARDGREAVEKTRDAKPILAILDISMPVMDGFSAAAEIKKVVPGTQILILSFQKTETFTEVARRIGASGYLTKGDDSALLLKVIDAAMNGHL
jgi:CheY-like chemotaxis protein